MVPQILIAAGVALAGYKAYYDRLPLARKLKVGDQASVPAAEVMQAVGVPGTNLFPIDAMAIITIASFPSKGFLQGKVESIIAADGKQITIPGAGSSYASVTVPTLSVKSATREGDDGVIRSVT